MLRDESVSSIIVDSRMGFAYVRVLANRSFVKCKAMRYFSVSKLKEFYHTIN